MEVYLVRHGQTDWNRDFICQGRIDNKLNEEGKKQAYDLALKIKESGLTFDKYLSTPLTRTKTTLNIIKEVLGVKDESEEDAHFIERDFGALEGRDVYFVRKVIADNTAVNFENYEPDEKVAKRVYEGLLGLYKKYGDAKRILVVCHSHAIKNILHYLEPSKYDLATHLDNMNVSLFEVSENSVKIKKAKVF